MIFRCPSSGLPFRVENSDILDTVAAHERCRDLRMLGVSVETLFKREEMGKRNAAYMMLLLRHERLEKMLASGSLIDGRKGGLVVGPSHKEGNIYLLHQILPEKYEILGDMEGGEYLLSHTAYRLFHDRIDKINAWEQSAVPEELEIPGGSRVINASGEKAWKIILIDRRGQFIVNKWATSRFFSEIDELNRRAEGYPDVN